MALQSYVPSPKRRLFMKQLWNLCPQLFLVVFRAKVMDISCLWMFYNLSYQLARTFKKKLAFKPILNNLIEDVLIMKLKSSCSKWINTFWRFFIPFISFLHTFDKKKCHNMLALIDILSKVQKQTTSYQVRSWKCCCCGH